MVVFRKGNGIPKISGFHLAWWIYFNFGKFDGKFSPEDVHDAHVLDTWKTTAFASRGFCVLDCFQDQSSPKKETIWNKKHRGPHFWCAQKLFFLWRASNLTKFTIQILKGETLPPNLRRPSSKIKTLIIRFSWRTSIPAASWIWGFRIWLLERWLVFLGCTNC